MMKGRIFILLVLQFASIASHYSFAQQTTTAELLNSDEITSEQHSKELLSTRDTIALGDSIVVIHTVCAPICSSRVRVYNKEWKEIGIMRPPFKSAFPEAYVEDGNLLWHDNDTFDYTPCF